MFNAVACASPSASSWRPTIADPIACAPGSEPDPSLADAILDRSARLEQDLGQAVTSPAQRQAIAQAWLADLLAWGARFQVREIRLHAQAGHAAARYLCDGQHRDLAPIPMALMDELWLWSAAALRASVRRGAAGRFEWMRIGGPHARAIVLRPVPSPAPVAALDQLGFAEADRLAIRRQLGAPSGLVLVAGPSDSGRSTTAYSMLLELDPSRRTIHTLEAPVWRPVPGWLQVEVKAVRGATGADLFQHGLQALLRAGADVLLLGRMASPELLELAVHAVESGTLVVAVAPLDRASRILARLRALYRKRALGDDVLTLAIAQRLLARPCGHCSLPDDRDEVRRVLAAALNTWMAQATVRPRRAAAGGCPQCGGSGYAGRTLAYELIEIDARARGLMASAADAFELERALLPEGSTLWDSGLQRLACGATSLEALRASIREPR